MAKLKKYEVTFRNARGGVSTTTTLKLTPEHAKEYETNGAEVKELGAKAQPAPAQTKKRTAKNK